MDGVGGFDVFWDRVPEFRCSVKMRRRGGVRIERLEDRNVREGEYSSISVIKYLGAWPFMIL